MSLPKKQTLIFSLFFLTFLGFAQEAHAIFDFSALPRRGGQSVRFEGGKPGMLLRNEEVTLTVTSTLASQYRIYQTVYQPLTSDRGDTIPQGAFIVFSPSSPLGTLRTQQETPLTMGQMPVYTSNAAGDSDEFTLVFNVHVPENQPGGIYHTQVTFTAEPVNAQGGVSPRVVNMDVSVEITPSFQITLQNSKGGRDLNFGKINKDHPTTTAFLKTEIGSNIGTPYKFIQQISEPLVSQDGTILDEDFLVFSVVGASRGSLAVGATPSKLSSSPTLIYTSDATGGSDAFELQYQTLPDINPKAGIYSGVLSFKVESTSPLVPSQVFNVPVRIEIESIFYLDVQLDQGTVMNFGTFRTGDEKQQRRVNLTIHSNLGQPYQIMELMTRKLTNQEGAVIPQEYFQFFGSDAKTGNLAVMSPTPMEEGERVVFTSDRKGTPEQFTLNYMLTVPKEIHSGSYSTETTYSITAL